LASNFGLLGALNDASALRQLGVAWDRPHPGPFVWGQIEEERGSYDWREVDYYVQWAQWYGFAIQATIWPFASWDQANWQAGSSGPGASEIIFEREMGRDRRKPHDMDAYGQFVSALVERYDGDGNDDMPGLRYPIRHWEASNEPSMQEGLHVFFDGTSEDYLEILEATYRAAKGADPEAVVLHAGMAGMEPWMVSFWEPVFQNGSQYFDIANIHSIGGSDELNVPEFRALLSKHGIDKPIWVTEAQHRAGRTHDGRVISQEEHARILAKSYVLSFALGTEKIFYTTFRAPPFGNGEFEQSALAEWDGQGRPAYYAMQTLIRKLDGFASAERLADGQYKFSVGDRTIYVLWGSGGLPPEIAGDVAITDIYGEETTATSETVILTGSPIFVESAAAQ
jgi:hypothetical protein